MAIEAVLWDVGGPLNTELEHERLADISLREGFELARHPIDHATYDAAWKWAIDSYAPNAYSAVVWRLSRHDPALSKAIYQEFERKSHDRNVFQLRDGIDDLLSELHALGLKLGLVANQPSATIEKLNRHGVGKYFQHAGVSGKLGFRKPDVRLFLAACDALGAQPADCLMVGDRIDNDIAPARQLGMRTILLRTGRHIHQQPRTWDEIPDATVNDVDELRRAILNTVGNGS